MDASALSIDDLLPHRPPFRFVDRLAWIDAGAGCFELCLGHEDPRLRDGELPPLLLLEALAQSVAAYHGAGQRDGAPERGWLVEIRAAQIHATARGGDVVQLHVEHRHSFGSMVRFHGRAAHKERCLVQGELTVARQEAESP